jgi:hypothetical protein
MGACQSSTIRPSGEKTTEATTAGVRYVRVTGDGSATSDQSLTLFVRFFDASLDASKHDIECALVGDNLGAFVCSQLVFPINAGTIDHRIWVTDPARRQPGFSTAGVVASNIYVNGSKVRIFPNPQQEFGFFQIDGNGQVR